MIIPHFVVKADLPGVQLFYRQLCYAGNTELAVQSVLNQVNAEGSASLRGSMRFSGAPRGTVATKMNLDVGPADFKNSKSVGR